MAFRQRLVDRPEKLLGHVRISRPVRVGRAVAARRSTGTYLGKRSSVVAKVVAKVVQTQRMRQMSIHHGEHVTERTEGPGLYFVLFREIICDSVRNPA